MKSNRRFSQWAAWLILALAFGAHAAAEIAPGDRIEGHSLEGLITDGWAVRDARHIHVSPEMRAQGVPGWSEYVLEKDGWRLNCVFTVEWLPPELLGQAWLGETFVCVAEPGGQGETEEDR